MTADPIVPIVRSPGFDGLVLMICQRMSASGVRADLTAAIPGYRQRRCVGCVITLCMIPDCLTDMG